MVDKRSGIVVLVYKLEGVGADWRFLLVGYMPFASQDQLAALAVKANAKSRSYQITTDFSADNGKCPQGQCQEQGPSSSPDTRKADRNGRILRPCPPCFSTCAIVIVIIIATFITSGFEAYSTKCIQFLQRCIGGRQMLDNISRSKRRPLPAVLAAPMTMHSVTRISPAVCHEWICQNFFVRGHFLSWILQLV